MGHWFKLDNAAKIYPPTQTKTWAAMFRLSVTLTEPVDPELLARAQKTVLQRFPSFGCRLKQGMFWYYLEHNGATPPVFEDVYNPLQKFNAKANRHFLYRLLYYRNRIAVEYFHALTDGTGGMTFLLTLVSEYLRLKHGVPVPPGGYILDLSQEPDPEEYEDSFLRYSSKETVSRAEKVSYHTDGTAVPFNKLLIISARVPTDALKAKAAEYGVSIGVFLSAVLLHAVYRKQQTEKRAAKRRREVKISIPINLRAFFPSRTLRNFSLYLNPGINSRLGEYTFEEILNAVRHEMGLHVTAKELQARFSSNVAAERNPFIRIAPLFLKKPILKAAFLLQGDRYFASTISNLGLIRLPEEFSKYVERIDFLQGRSTTRRSTCGCVSYNGQTVINFSRTTAEADIERFFFTSLVKMGIPVFLESNGRC